MPKNSLDLLLIEPSLDWRESTKIKISMRIEENEPTKENLKISTGYLISSVKNKGYNVKFIDMAVEKVGVDDFMEYIKVNNPMVIGSPAFTFQVPVVVKLFSKIKKTFPNIILCIGGCHVTSLPEKTLKDYPDIDFLICGEAETTIPIVLGRIKSGLNISDIPGVFVNRGENSNDVFWEDVNNIPFPAWEEFKISKYAGFLPNMGKREFPVINGRGCPFKCIFCCRQSGTKCRRRSVESVIEEIERNVKDFNCDSISFMDETFILDKQWINNFLKKMQSSGLNKKIKWYCSTRVSSVSLELLQELKEAGCCYIFYGFESANRDVLEIIKKGTSPEQMQDAVKWTKKSGIVPIGSFIIGLPGDTRSSIIETIEFGKNLDLYSITFPIAVPFPGTELRRMAINGEYGMRIITDEWSEYISNDFDAFGVGKIGHLESVDLSWEERKELQKFAYNRNPKKKILKYLESIS